MHVDRLRWLVQERKHLTLDGATEIAKAAPELLKLIERLEQQSREPNFSIVSDHASRARKHHSHISRKRDYSVLR